ncbi:fimbrillin family protein [uncultured Parabacteroides sp.]|uniref:fimbrillin family protein n=1 Tax=uncultured Parabacteroides sp. TaxID=512312 RepID=UPI0028038230|nr:fimbrillin family protein [uncultured Parabacteroides sp.]
MKRTTIHISAALALLLALAACTRDEAGFLPEGAEGTPIVFTATGLNPAATATAGTRAPVDGDWEGVQSVAVRMDGTVKAYDVTPTTADNTSATLTSTDPHYWTNHDDITVTAWWPYTEGETTPPAVVVRADQSSPTDFEGSDFISAENQPVSYGNPTLRFTHRTARVTVVLTDYTEGMASVKLTGLSTENGNPAEIAPYDKGGDTYTALVAPQSVATGTTFITCAFTNGKVFVYKMKEATDWQAGEEYTYTVSLAAAKDPGYTVSEDGKTYEVYNAEGLKNIAELVNEEWKSDINITLTNNIDLTGIDWTPIGKDDNKAYTGTFDGNGKTITGLTVTRSNRYTGLFGFIKGTVKNVVLTEVNITSGTFVGGVAGWSFGGNIENCSVSGSVSGSSGSDVGGVVGYQQVGSITGCSSSATVKGTERAGGVVGVTNGGTTPLTACYATGNVTVENDGTSNAWAGGIVGMNGTGTLIACYAAGNVSGNIVGGAVGVNYATVTACYWSGLPDNDNGGATKVDGTTVTWQNAVDAMNNALNGSGWQYELTGALPTLKKQ